MNDLKRLLWESSPYQMGDQVALVSPSFKRRRVVGCIRDIDYYDKDDDYPMRYLVQFPDQSLSWKPGNQLKPFA